MRIGKRSERQLTPRAAKPGDWYVSGLGTHFRLGPTDQAVCTFDGGRQPIPWNDLSIENRTCAVTCYACELWTQKEDIPMPSGVPISGWYRHAGIVNSHCFVGRISACGGVIYSADAAWRPVNSEFPLCTGCRQNCPMPLVPRDNRLLSGITRMLLPEMRVPAAPMTEGVPIDLGDVVSSIVRSIASPNLLTSKALCSASIKLGVLRRHEWYLPSPKEGTRTTMLRALMTSPVYVRATTLFALTLRAAETDDDDLRTAALRCKDYLASAHRLHDIEHDDTAAMLPITRLLADAFHAGSSDTERVIAADCAELHHKLLVRPWRIIGL